MPQETFCRGRERESCRTRISNLLKAMVHFTHVHTNEKLVVHKHVCTKVWGRKLLCFCIIQNLPWHYVKVPCLTHSAPNISFKKLSPQMPDLEIQHIISFYKISKQTFPGLKSHLPPQASHCGLWPSPTPLGGSKILHPLSTPSIPYSQVEIPHWEDVWSQPPTASIFSLILFLFFQLLGGRPVNLQSLLPYEVQLVSQCPQHSCFQSKQQHMCRGYALFTDLYTIFLVATFPLTDTDFLRSLSEIHTSVHFFCMLWHL